MAIVLDFRPRSALPIEHQLPTLCSHHRMCLFGNPRKGETFIQYRSSSSHAAQVKSVWGRPSFCKSGFWQCLCPNTVRCLLGLLVPLKLTSWPTLSGGHLGAPASEPCLVLGGPVASQPALAWLWGSIRTARAPRPHRVRYLNNFPRRWSTGRGVVNGTWWALTIPPDWLWMIAVIYCYCYFLTGSGCFPDGLWMVTLIF